MATKKKTKKLPPWMLKKKGAPDDAADSVAPPFPKKKAKKKAKPKAKK